MPRMNPSVVKSDTSKQSNHAKTARGKSMANGNTKKESKQSSTSSKQAKRKKQSSVKYYTHDGHSLTVLEAKFIDLYIETGNQRQSVLEAGYKTNTPSQYAQLP